MKKIYFLVVINLIFIIRVANSQNLIAVQNGGNSTFYTKLDSAILHAVHGDTIYLPGGYYSFVNGNIDLNKQVHIIGVGHNPDSTSATVATHITNTLVLFPGASGGSLTGVYLDNYIDFPSYGEHLNNYTVSRSNISLGVWANLVSNMVFIENVIRGDVKSQYNNVQYWVFYNNVFEGRISSLGDNAIFKNNVFLNQSGVSTISYMTTSTFENNVFLKPNNAETLYGNNYNIYNNNLFVENILFPIGNNIGNNNIVNQTESGIFINQSGSSFSYSQDYHLQETCLGKDAGTDGTDIGFYGGPISWKCGSVPFNPHIQSKYIGGATDPYGNLNVNIKVAAQDH